MELLTILLKSIAAGVAGIGFAILFNVPQRVLVSIAILSAMGDLIKFGGMYLKLDIVFASFLAATAIGILSIKMAHAKNSPPLVFYIPSVIPLVPGFFIYNMMLGFMSLTQTDNPESYIQNLIATTNNGTKAVFILISLGIGVAVPMLITRKETIKNRKNQEAEPVNKAS